MDERREGDSEFDLTPDEDRLTQINRVAFERAVTKATEQSTQNISQIHRRRLVRHTAVVTAVVMALFGVAIVLLIKNDNGAQAKADAKFNCRLFSRVALDMSQFVATDANLRKQQQLNSGRIAALRPGELKRLFTDPETVRLSKQSAKLDANTTHFWKTFIVTDLGKLAATNCQQNIH